MTFKIKNILRWALTIVLGIECLCLLVPAYSQVLFIPAIFYSKNDMLAVAMLSMPLYFIMTCVLDAYIVYILIKNKIKHGMLPALFIQCVAISGPMIYLIENSANATDFRAIMIPTISMLVFAVGLPDGEIRGYLYLLSVALHLLLFFGFLVASIYRVINRIIKRPPPPTPDSTAA